MQTHTHTPLKFSGQVREAIQVEQNRFAGKEGEKVKQKIVDFREKLKVKAALQHDQGEHELEKVCLPCARVRAACVLRLVCKPCACDRTKAHAAN